MMTTNPLDEEDENLEPEALIEDGGSQQYSDGQLSQRSSYYSEDG